MENKYLILVNQNHPLHEEEQFKKVVCPSLYCKGRMLEKKTCKQFLKLKKFIKKCGYTIEFESGYRTKEYQQKIWDECVKLHGLKHTKKYVSPPGYSEHQTGLALDFLLYENGQFYEEHKMKGHPVLKLVAENAYKYGFIIRYPKGKENITGYNYEPWHLRYIKNIDKAKFIRDNNLCLEEFLKQEIGEKSEESSSTRK